MDAAPTVEERAAVDAVLGAADSGWTGGEREIVSDGRVARAGREVRERRPLLLPALHALQAPLETALALHRVGRAQFHQLPGKALEILRPEQQAIHARRGHFEPVGAIEMLIGEAMEGQLPGGPIGSRLARLHGGGSPELVAQHFDVPHHDH